MQRRTGTFRSLCYTFRELTNDLTFVPYHSTEFPGEWEDISEI